MVSETGCEPISNSIKGRFGNFRTSPKTFYFDDPNGIRLQIELKTKPDADSLEGDPDPVPYVRALLQRA